MNLCFPLVHLINGLEVVLYLFEYDRARIAFGSGRFQRLYSDKCRFWIFHASQKLCSFCPTIFFLRDSRNRDWESVLGHEDDLNLIYILAQWTQSWLFACHKFFLKTIRDLNLCFPLVHPINGPEEVQYLFAYDRACIPFGSSPFQRLYREKCHFRSIYASQRLCPFCPTNLFSRNLGYREREFVSVPTDSWNMIYIPTQVNLKIIFSVSPKNGFWNDLRLYSIFTSGTSNEWALGGPISCFA